MKGVERLESFGMLMRGIGGGVMRIEDAGVAMAFPLPDPKDVRHDHEWKLDKLNISRVFGLC